MKMALILPVRNPGAWLDRLLPALASQRMQPDEWLVVDSASDDGSADRLRQAGADVICIEAASFNHGGTRRMACERVQADVLIFLTQDAIPADPDCFLKLCRALAADDSLGLAYGRQLPHPGAGPLAVHARSFNYPAESRTKRLADAAELGIKTCFCSDSFCAYRRQALRDVGGFPANVIGTEDAYVAGRMLLAGWGIRYAADAMVFHSHEYDLLEEFRRYFDIGVFYGREHWISESFGAAGGEGRRFVLSEMKYLCAAGQWWRLPESVVRSAIKWCGYQSGRRENLLPKPLKRSLSMFKGYWT